MKVKALTEHRYGSKLHKVGAEYEIKGAGDLRLYKALGRVVEAPDVVVVATPAISRGTYHAKVMEAADTDRVAEVKSPAAKKVATKRAYNRRDQTANE